MSDYQDYKFAPTRTYAITHPSVNRSYTLQELTDLPTLAQGQAADLKIDTGTFRVWVSRCGPEDGENRPVQYEVLLGGNWLECAASGSLKGKR